MKVRSNVPLNAPIRIEGMQPLGLDVSIKGAAVDAKTSSAPVEIGSNYNSQIGRFDMVLVARSDSGGRDGPAGRRSQPHSYRVPAIVLWTSTLKLIGASSGTLH